MKKTLLNVIAISTLSLYCATSVASAEERVDTTRTVVNPDGTQSSVTKSEVITTTPVDPTTTVVTPTGPSDPVMIEEEDYDDE